MSRDQKCLTLDTAVKAIIADPAEAPAVMIELAHLGISEPMPKTIEAVAHQIGVAVKGDR